MKNKLLLTRYLGIAMALLVFVFNSCDDDDEGGQAVEESFSAGFDVSAMFLEVTFINTSTNGRSYEWDFGVEDSEDDVSLDFAPTFTYPADGTYTVSLTVTGASGLTTDTFTSDITVGEEMILPMAAFTSEVTFLDVAFTDTSENAISHAWDFGDGVGVSNEASPMYSYAEAGTFTVTLTVTSETDDTDTIAADITVEVAPVTPIADFTSEANDLMVTFTDASVTNGANVTAYAWDFGDGVGMSTEQNPIYTYAAAGDFDVTLTITFDEVNGETTASVTESISVNAGTVSMDGPGTPGNQFAFITDTDASDTGELRLDLANALAMGRMTVVVSKEMTQDGFINLSGGSTSRRNAMIDMRLNDGNGYEFTESGDNVTAPNFPAFVNDEFVEVDITWDATVATAPLITVTIDGQPVTATPFESAGQDPGAIADGVITVQFRLGGNSDIDPTGAGFFVDNLRVYDTSSGTPVIVFEDDYENYNVGDSLDPDVTPTAMNTPYRNNSSEAVVNEEAGTVSMDGPGTPGNQFAFITDTDAGDTGELRLDLANTLAMGRMTVVVSKEMTQDGFINLSGGSTSRRNAMIDMRLNDGNGYEFTESGDNVTAPNFPAFMNDEFVEVDITWDATVATAPLITVTIDGQPVTAAAFESAGQDPGAIADGVITVQFRLGGNSDIDPTGAGFFVDNLRVYDTSSGTPVIVFEDDYENYNVGDSLDPDVTPTAMNTPYRNNSSEAVVAVE